MCHNIFLSSKWHKLHNIKVDWTSVLICILFTFLSANTIKVSPKIKYKKGSRIKRNKFDVDETISYFEFLSFRAVNLEIRKKYKVKNITYLTFQQKSLWLQTGFAVNTSLVFWVMPKFFNLLSPDDNLRNNKAARLLGIILIVVSYSIMLKYIPLPNVCY